MANKTISYITVTELCTMLGHDSESLLNNLSESTEWAFGSPGTRTLVGSNIFLDWWGIGKQKSQYWELVQDSYIALE